MKKICIYLFIFIIFITTTSLRLSAQITGKFGTYYDQRELLFENMPTSTSDIIFLGNSITDGAEWSEIFQNPHCKNRGISADIILGVLNRLETVTKGKPAMVFLMIGTNDMNLGASNDSIARGVRAIVQRIKSESPKTHIVVQSILPVNDHYGYFSGHTKRWQDVAVINGLLRNMAIEEEVDYLDLYHPFANAEGKLDIAYSNDGLHLNGKGYELWKNIIKETYGDFTRPVYKPGENPMWLTAGTGLNIAHCYDQGASPLPYLGVGMKLRGGISMLWHEKSYIDLNLGGLANIVVSNAYTQAFDFGIDWDIEYLYRFYNVGGWHFWAGGALSNYISVNYSPSLMNAALGYSLFLFNGTAEGVVQYDFAKYGGDHNMLTAYAKLGLPLFSLVNRPGFAYIDNATGSLTGNEPPESNRERLLMGFPGVSTDIGLYVNLLNNNKIGVSYRWDYLTTRHKGIYRFDHANHSFNLTYMFNLY